MSVQPKLNSTPIPRFEFRAFAQSFGLVAEKIRARSECPEIRESTEQYVLCREAVHWNVKLRDGRLQIKRLVEQHQGLERWKPTTDEKLPVSREFLDETLFPALGFDNAELSQSSYTQNELLDKVVWPSRDLRAITVLKRRFRFCVEGCPTEIDELLINRAGISSVAVESEDRDKVLHLIDKIGLTEYENINYPRAIRRIIGLERWQEEASYLVNHPYRDW